MDRLKYLIGLSAYAAFAGSLLLQQSVHASLVQQATEEIRAGNFQAASNLLHANLRTDAKDAELWNLLGIAETELNHVGPAQDAFERGLQLAPQSTSLNENVGFLFFRRADYPNAEKYLAKAISLGSDKPGVRFSLAAAMLRNGQSAQALAALQSLERVLSGAPDYWEERGRAELVRDPSAAEQSFDRALALDPNRPGALNGAATAAEKQGLDEKALALLIKAREANPNDLPTLDHFAMVCLRRDLGPDAIAALERARRIEPDDNSSLYLLARANISVENWQKAYELFNEFARRVPSFAPTYFAMGWLDIKLNRLEEARRHLQRCLALAPSLTDARYELAQLDLDDGRLDSAQDLIQAVLKQNPNHAKANMAMGDLMMRRGNLQQAQQFLETAARLDPELASAHYKLSMLYVRRHQPEEAERERKLALALTAEASHQSKNQLKLVLPESESMH